LLLVKPLKEESGYSMVEVMVAIMILAIAIIPMVGMFDVGLRASSDGSNYDKARMLATERLETVKALPYFKPDLAANSAVEIYRPGTPVSGTSGIFSYTVTTTYFRESEGNIAADTSDNSVVKPMTQVVVRVTWNGRSYETTGFTALGGI
jgi:prepilin-type N-terminal cleavage/methylation domain-containing protein